LRSAACPPGGRYDTYDLVLTPAIIVAAFPVERRYLAAHAGTTFGNYLEWLAIAYAITLACWPALALPCGFTAEELPVGLQVVAPPRAEARLPAGARLIEEVLDLRMPTPIAPRG
jgi:amidase